MKKEHDKVANNKTLKDFFAMSYKFFNQAMQNK